MTPAQPIIRFDRSSERQPCSLQALLADVALARAGRSLPFTPERVRVVVRFADSLAGEPAFRDVRALQAFAFWIRRSAIARLQSDFAVRLPANSIAVGRGTAFHLPPANVDTIFLYSWVVAFLAGNVSITRLPSVLDDAIERALGLLVDLLRDSGFDDAFLFYPASDEINRALSHIADLRFVWGGTVKVAAFENLPLRSGGRSIAFPDRYSYSVIDGAYLAGLDASASLTLARHLYNDIFVFNQMACSSPHLLYVVGNPAAHAGCIEQLVFAVDQVAQASGTAIDPAHDIEKFTAATRLAAEGAVVRARRFSPEMMTVELATAISPRVGGGFLGIAIIAALNELAGRISERDQTLGYAGFTRGQMAAFAGMAGTAGLCRIVPIGQALDFDAVWDGHDLLAAAVRLIRIL